MGLVKTVTLQVTGEIRDAAAKVGLVSRDWQALADKSPLELKAELAGEALVKAKLDSIGARAEELKKNFPEFAAKIDIGAASAKLAVLRKEMRGTSRAAGTGGLLGAVEGLIGSGGAAAGAGGVAGGFGLAGLAVVIGEVSGALAAATIGIGSFAALAFPTLSEISKGYGNITKDTLAFNRATTAAAKSKALQKMKDDWAALDPGVQGAIKGVQGFVDLWHKLARALEPDVLKIFNEGLKIADQLLPDLLPFAKAAAGAIDGLLKSFGRFAASAGFKSFQAQMLKLSGPAITALGQGFGKIAIAVGKLLLAMAKPQGIAALNRLLGFTADAIGALSWVLQRGAGNWQKWIDILHQTANKFDEFRHDFAIGAHEIAVHFDGMRHAAADWAHNLASWFDEVRHNIATWAHDVAHTFDQWRHGIAQKTDAVVSFFIRMPGRIGHALAGLPGLLFNIGKRAIQGLINGLLSLWHKLLGLIGRIKGLLGFGGGGGDPGGGAGANMVIARRMMPAWSTGNEWASWVQLNNRESGWNRFAENPQSGAYGIPQALPPTKMPFAAQKAGGSNASAQIGWQIGYIRQRYGSPIGAWGHELTHGWYDGPGPQFLPRGLSLALNTTGFPERVLSPGEQRGLEKRLDKVIALLERAPQATGAATAAGTMRALNGLRIPVPRARGG